MDSFNIINLCVLIKNNNKNAIDYYNKNKNIMKIFFEKFSSLERIIDYLEKSKNIEIVTPSTKKNINLCHDTVKQLLRDMLQILKYMKLDIIGYPVN